MKIQVAAALCLVLLVTSELVVTSAAAGFIWQMVPCMPASKNAKVAPSKQCCSNITKMGQGLKGARCLCSLLSNSLAISQGLFLVSLLASPQKCRIAVPKSFVCQGIRIPGS